ALADDLATPLLVVLGTGGPDATPAPPAVTVEGAEVSALRRAPDGSGREVRLWNPSSRPATASVDGHPVELRPWEIRVQSVG
nr:hypothetical protein [Acidimicrobiia bacterium]